MGIKSYMIAEIRKHVIVMIQSLAPYILVLVISFAIWNLIFYLVVCPYRNEYHSIDEKTYSNVIVSNSYYEDYPSVLWKLDNIVSYTNQRGKVLNSNTYVQINDNSIYCFDLEPGEIAISNKMAKKLKLEVGDTVKADISIYDSPREYVVKYIFPYSSDLYNSLDNLDFSVVIMYPGEDLLNFTKGKFNYFLNETKYDEYMEKQLSYSSRFSLEQEKQDVYSIIFIRCIILNIFLSIVCFVAMILIHRKIGKEVEKYYQEGYSKKKLSTINRVDHFIFLLIPFCAQFIFEMGSYNKMFVITICSVSELITVLTLALIIGISGEVKYGKAN